LEAEERLEGKLINDVINIKENDFDKWCQDALNAADNKLHEQYYPDRTLLTHQSLENSINLSINTIADASDDQQVRGALVVMDDISDEKRLKSTMYRYMTQELAEELLKLDDAKLGGDRKEVSILFSDIRGYTTLTENLEAEEVVGMLNEYFESMVEAVFKHKGTLDKYIGDAIMAVYGSPLPLQNHAWMAVQTSLEMRHRLNDFNIRRHADNKPEIKIGIGINSDVVISGNIGSSKRMEFTAIGDGVNLGSRLESVSKQYGCDIIISDNTHEPCKHLVWARELDYIRVKGRNEPVSIYELIGLRGDNISGDKLTAIEHYHKGREYYINRQFTSAKNQFALCLEIEADDKAAISHLKRCHHWLDNPHTHDDWDDGVWTYKEK
ncbi:MAG: adenylate/guanylate cyclase domain-containing protein, partial [Rivularia sp. (in: cyanobacteria)]